MIVAIKDDLQIEVTVDEKKVSIQLPDMQDVLFLWDSWIKQEEQSAEKAIKSQSTREAYPLLVEYFEDNGWEIVKSNF